MSYKEELYTKWIAGTLTDDELKSLEDSGELAELQRIMDVGRQLQLPKYNHEEEFAYLINARKEKQTFSNQYSRVLIGLAAGLALFFFIRMAFTSSLEEISAPYGEVAQIALGDGSAVTLNAGSTLEYNRKQWKNSRSVSLEGEGFFAVSEGTPFVVNTNNGRIKVLGTAFNIRSWSDNLYVECYTGSVEVTSASGISDTLFQRQSINIVNNTLGAVQNIQHQKPHWSTGNSRFYKERVASVLAEIGRQFDVEIKHPNIEDRFSGAFSHKSLQAALREVCKPLNLNYHIDSATKSVTISQE